MTRRPAMKTRLLDLTAAIGLAGPALMLLYSSEWRPIWIIVTVSVLLLAAIAMWIVWRRSGQRSRTAALFFVAVATATMALGDGALYYGIVWVACLILGVTFASRIPLLAFALALVCLVITLHVSAGSPALTTFTEAVGAAILGGMAAVASGVLRDSLNASDALATALTERDAAHAELQQRIAADQDLVLAQERERTARDLHDDLGHRLTAIGFSLDYAARIDDPDAARAEVVHARNLVGDSLDAMRRIVRAMHPVELAALHDVASFAVVASAFDSTGITVDVSIDGNADLPRAHSLLLLRFVQEGLTNVLKHGDDPGATLFLSVRDGRVIAAMANIGRETTTVTEGFGLRSLRSRAQELGGSLQAEASPAQFRLTMSLPLSPTLGRSM